jgi:hypothetical protein
VCFIAVEKFRINRAAEQQQSALAAIALTNDY